MSVYTGNIHHSTATATFYNKEQDSTFYCDERDLHDYIDTTTGEVQEMYIKAMRDLQNYKQEHDIELSYTPVDEWELTNYNELDIG